MHSPRRLLLGALSGLGLGLAARVLLGPTHPVVDTLATQVAEPLGKLFLRILLVVVVPLVAASVAGGVAGLGELRRVGRLGLATLALTVIVSATSVGIGLLAADLVHPGTGLDPEVRNALVARYAPDAGKIAISAPRGSAPLAALVELVPRNPLTSAASDPPDLLGLLVVAVLFGAALLALDEPRRKPLTDLLDAMTAATGVIVGWAMALAPLGVGCLLFVLGARFGFDLLVVLARFALTVIGALLVHAVVVYGLLLRLVARRSPWAFARDAREVLLMAFATSSSNATLPTALRVASSELGIPAPVAGFVLTVGATANQNGTALFEGIAVLFLAQVFGVPLDASQQLAVMGMAVAAGIGTAGVPSASLPFVALVLGTIGVPPEALALLIGVDRILDMCRTTVNVAGDLVIAAIIARWDGATAAIGPASREAAPIR